METREFTLPLSEGSHPAPSLRGDTETTRTGHTVAEQSGKEGGDVSKCSRRRLRKVTPVCRARVNGAAAVQKFAGQP